jgi:hypothetical protein
LETAAYALDQVQPLPLNFAEVVRNLFYPDTAKATAPAPSLCRIYFGKVISEVGREGQPHRFFNSSNFPLDVGRYQKVVDADEAGFYPDVEDIAYGMGEMLGRLHRRARYDGRDIEFFLGGRGFNFSNKATGFGKLRRGPKTFVFACIDMTLLHIHNLPAEILLHIFHLCCTNYVLNTHPARKQPDNSLVLLLVQVCSRWRQLLLHAPMFWDSVRTSSDPSQLSLASRWLSRAWSRPHSLSFGRYGPAAPIQSLIARFPFSRIALHIRSDAERLEFSEIPIESFLPLKVLELGNSKTDSSQLSLGHHSFSNLSTLYVCQYFDSLSALVTSKTIEKLWIDLPAPISICLEILRSATNLRELLKLVVDDDERVASIQDVVAPNLTDARLDFTSGYGAGSFISALTAPNLKNLRMPEVA